LKPSSAGDNGPVRAQASPNRLKFLTVTKLPICRTLTLSLLSIAAVGQAARRPPVKPPAASGKLAAIHVGGTHRYTPAEVIAASGLEVGTAASEDDFRKGAQRLGECGFFSNVSYSYSTIPTGTKLDLELTDSDKLVPAHFENFVWFTEDELLARIHERLPLFKGQVPIGGTLSDQISDILQNLLVPLSLSGRVEYVRESKDPGGPIDAINFRVTGVTLTIADLTFRGAGTEEMPALKEASEKLLGKDYSRSAVLTYATTNLLPVYSEHGFLNASISDPQPKVVGDTADETEVSVQLTVSPGAQYKISDIRWEGSKTFSTEKLQGLVHAKPGELANAPLLKADLDAIHTLYRTRGYMMASVKPEAKLDDAAKTAAYTLTVSEGDIFHLGDLDIQGLDPKTVDRLREAWTLRESDPYDSTYPERFFKDTVKLLSRDVTWTISIHEGVNEDEKTVDVTLRYGIKPPS
jgi:outer membrane protein assembly factor BamA